MNAIDQHNRPVPSPIPPSCLRIAIELPGGTTPGQADKIARVIRRRMERSELPVGFAVFVREGGGRS
jgi:hypothetical protein